MGPPDEMPDFPLYDSFSLSGITTRPYRIDYNCNWLQILDAIMDPIHTSFLHSTISGTQFSEGLGEIGELEIHERGIQFLGSNTRRVNEHVWVRVNELILPNFTQAGAAFAADGTKTRFFWSKFIYQMGRSQLMIHIQWPWPGEILGNAEIH